jgi:hypothetical protein
MHKYRYNSFLVSLIIPLLYRLEQRGFLYDEIPFPPNSVWMLQDWLMIEFPLYEYCGIFGTDNGHIWSCSHGDHLTFGRVYLSFNIFNQNIVCLCIFFFNQAMERRRRKLKTWLPGKCSKFSKLNLIMSSHPIIIQFPFSSYISVQFLQSFAVNIAIYV